MSDPHDPEGDELEQRRDPRRRPGGPPDPPPRPVNVARPWLEDDPGTTTPVRSRAMPPAAPLAPRDPPTEYVAVPRGAVPQGGNRGCLILGGMGLLTVLACMLLFYGALQSGFDRLTGFQFPGINLPQATPTIITTQPAVILQVQALSRLETQRYVVEKVIQAEIPGILPPPFTGDKILFIGHGSAVAGVDLGRMRPEDIVVYTATDRVELRVPAAELFDVSLDEQLSRVYDRQTGVFSRPDPNLETAVRQEAERQIRQAALEGGILQQAEDNARKTLTALISGLGYTNVSITFQAPLTPGPTPASP